MGIESYVELGIGSSWEHANLSIKVVTVDILPNGFPGIDHVQGDSHNLDTLHRVLELLGSQPDCVFIDADHEYSAVYQDFDMWYPAATKLVGFHDILMPGVSQFWNEIKRQYPSVEIIARDPASGEQWQRGSGTNGDLNVGGIGVIFRNMVL
jgi:23S rRNA U2552 (ribose-2'-O)-methylase RlmE/FtsJ